MLTVQRLRFIFLKFRKDPIEPQTQMRGFDIDKTDNWCFTNYAKLPSTKTPFYSAPLIFAVFRNLVQEIWFKKSGSRNLVREIWFKKSGSRNMVQEIWFEKYGCRNVVLETWV